MVVVGPVLRAKGVFPVATVVSDSPAILCLQMGGMVVRDKDHCPVYYTNSVFSCSEPPFVQMW